MESRHAKLSNWRNELIPNIVDHLAKVVPDGPFALYPNSPLTYEHGYRTVTYKDFANAINGLAWWLENSLGRSENLDVLAYIGPNDICYNALVVAAIKVGYLAFFPSPRNSIAAHVALLGETKCRTLLTSNPTPPGVEAILNASSVRHVQVPSVKELLENAYPHYQFDKQFESSKSEPLLIVHTSGSTGIPKPIYWTHDTFATHMNMTSLEPPPGFQVFHRLHQGKRILNTFPPFHAASFGVGLLNSLPYGTICIAPTSGGPPSADGLVQALKHAPADVAFLIPLIAAELVQKPELLEYCSQHLEHMFYAGGHLPRAIGDAIASKVPIHNQYGATEMGLSSQLFNDGSVKEWQYVQFHPDLGHEFEEVTPGLFELLVRKNPKYEKNQVTFTMRPSLHELDLYRTRDLFEKHPDLPDHWAWRARADDIIVFLNGEKTNPISMEQHIVTSNEDVANAMVVGMQRFQAALLIEPGTTAGELNDSEVASFIEKIWPSIEEANQISPAHARIEKSMIIVTHPEKPIIRSAKGTNQRQSTVALYESEIEELYTRVETELHGFGKDSVDSEDPVQVSSLIKQELSKVGVEPLPGSTDNLFALGMDSLMAMRLIRAMRHALWRYDLDVAVVYNNPSVQQLTDYLVSDKEHGTVPQQGTVDSLLAEYKKAIKSINQTSGAEESHGLGEVIILTGSTGSLGTHLLATFLSNPAVAHVYCLNRRENAEDIQREKAKAAGFQLDQHQGRVSFLRSALDQTKLGLDGSTYDLLASQATLIVHNAWPVNFNAPVDFFRPQLQGLLNLFQLASSCELLSKFLFISSVSSVAQSTSSSIPEEVVQDLTSPQDIGYAKSKLLSELLCDFAAEQLHLPVSFARVGQVAGPVDSESTALWNVDEWLPRLIVTSASMGVLPADIGPQLNRADWMPVELVSQALAELITGKTDPKKTLTGAEVFNVVAPTAKYWTELLPSIASSLEKYARKRVEVVPLESWLEKLQNVVEEFSSGNNTGLVSTHPAIKLQDFYEKAMLSGKTPVNWKIDRAVSKSETLRTMPAVQSVWIEKWVKGWSEELRSRQNSSLLNKLVAQGAFQR